MVAARAGGVGTGVDGGHSRHLASASGSSASSAEPQRRFSYERRRPELSTLHRVVRENLETLYAAVEAGFATAPLPDFVRRELEGFLDCGLLCRGFALLECEDCPERRLVAFSCHGRAFCPSCLGRRMEQTSLNLLEHVVPRVPLRQFVLTLPFELRTRLAYDGALLGAVCRVFVDSVLGFYRRRLRDLGIVGADGKQGKSGAITVVQRVNADLRLNPHLHCAALDGVYVANERGEPVFHSLPELDAMDVADLLQVVRVRILRLLERRGVIEQADELTLLPDDLAEREPALAQLAAASVSGLMPAGPERRDRPLQAIRLKGRAGVEMTGPLAATELGFSLDAATTAEADDELGRQLLLRYLLRPPIAHNRLKLMPSGLVRIELRRPFADGTVAVEMDPLSLLCRLAAMVPPPRRHTVRYSGVLAPASKLRPLVVPAPCAPPPAIGDDGVATDLPAAATPPTTAADDLAVAADPATRSSAPTTQASRPLALADSAVATSSCSSAPPSSPCSTTGRKPTHRCRWRPWTELLRRSFQQELGNCSCGGRMKLRALVTRPKSVRRILQHLGEPTDPPARAPARSPPFYRTEPLRRRLRADAAQMSMFQG